MEKNIEKEYKIIVNKAEFTTLLNMFKKPKFILQTNTYYDTLDSYLQKKKWAMRIRHKNGKNIFTLKTPISQDSLNEYETLCQSDYIDELINNQNITDLLVKKGINPPFKAIASIKTYRFTYSTDEYDLCFDYNLYNGKEDFEIEYEYLKKHDGLKNFNALLALINKKYQKNCPSKLKRCLTSQN